MSPYAENGYYIARVLLWIAAVLGIVFPFLYHHSTRGSWSFTPIGRHIMGTQAVFALMLLFTALALYVPVEVTITAGLLLYMLAIGAFIMQIIFIINPKTMDPQNVLDDPDSSSRTSRLLIRKDPPMQKSRPVVITMSILAGLQMLFGGLATLNLPNSGSYSEVALTVGAIGTLVVAAAQFGVQFYVQNLVTPQVDVAAYRTKTGQIVAGPAAPPEGENVDVVDEDTNRLH